MGTYYVCCGRYTNRGWRAIHCASSEWYGASRRELQLCPVGLSPPQDDPESLAEQCAHQDSSSMDTDCELLFLLNPRWTSASTAMPCAITGKYSSGDRSSRFSSGS